MSSSEVYGLTYQYIFLFSLLPCALLVTLCEVDRLTTALEECSLSVEHYDALDMIWSTQGHTINSFFPQVLNQNQDLAIEEFRNLLKVLLDCAGHKLNPSTSVTALLDRVMYEGKQQKHVLEAYRLGKNVCSAISRTQFALQEIDSTSALFLQKLVEWSQEGHDHVKRLSSQLQDAENLLHKVNLELGEGYLQRKETVQNWIESSEYENFYNCKNKSDVEKWFILNPEFSVHPSKRNQTERMQEAMAKLPLLDANMKKLENEIKDLHERMASAISQIKKQELKIIDMKTRQVSSYNSIKDLPNDKVHQEFGLGIDRGIHHILWLLYTSAEVIDSAEQVRDFQTELLSKVEERYGPEKASAFKKKRKYDEFQIVKNGEKHKRDDPVPVHNAVAARYRLDWKGAPYDQKKFSFRFAPATSDSRIITALSRLDFNCGTNVRVKIESKTNDQVSVETWGDSRINSTRICSLSISREDLRFQSGVWTFDTESSWSMIGGDQAHTSSKYIPFERVFNDMPSVRVFISSLDAEKSKEGQSLSTLTWVSSVSLHGFNLVTDVWDGRVNLNGLGIQWIAHSAKESTVRSGEWSFQDGDWSLGKSGSVVFDPPMSATPSVLFVGISGLRANFDKENLRLCAQLRESNSLGFHYGKPTWDDSRVKHYRFNWLAIL